MENSVHTSMRLLAAGHIAEGEREKQEILAHLDASKTVLFFGNDRRPVCSAKKGREYRRNVREMLSRLLAAGVSTVLVEYSSFYGYYALDEMVRQRRNHTFTLMLLRREQYGYSWLHSLSRKQSKLHSLKCRRKYAQCDVLLGALCQEEWL